MVNQIKTSLFSFWRRLIGQEWSHPEQRQASRLAFLLIVIIGLIILSHYLYYFLARQADSEFRIWRMIMIGVLGVGTFLLLRQQHYRLGIIFVTFLTNGVILATAVFTDFPDILFFLTLPLLLGSLFLSWHFTIVLITLNLAILWMVVFPVLQVTRMEAANLTTYLFFMGAVLWIAAEHRTWLAKFNRQELEQRVAERTVELAAANRSLRQQIVEREQAEAENRRWAQEVSTLNHIITAVSSSLTLSDVFIALVEALKDDLQIAGGAILLYEKADDTLEYMAGWGFPEDLLPSQLVFPVSAYYDTTVIRKKTAVYWPDFREIEVLREFGLGAVRPDWESHLSLPLLWQDKVQGILNLFSQEPFSQKQISFFSTIAHEVGIAIQNSRLFTAEKEARQIAETLQSANLALTQSLELDVILDTLLDNLALLVPYDSANVMLIDDENPSQLVVKALRGYEAWPDPEPVLNYRIEVESFPNIAKILSTKQSLIVADTAQQEDWIHIPELEDVASWMGIPLLAGGDVIGFYSLDKKEAGFFTHEYCRMAEALAAQAAVTIQNARLFSQLRQGQTQLRRLTKRVVTAQEEERHRVSRELHDEAGQALIALKYSLAIILSDLPEVSDDPSGQMDKLRRRVQAAVSLCEQTMAQVRLIAHDLRPAALDDLGLNPALEGFCADFAERTPFAIDYEGEEPPPLSDAVNISLYRFLQEALTNVLKHAAATNVSVCLQTVKNEVQLIVEDNGVGFDVQNVESTLAPAKGIGLSGMQERLQLVGGWLKIESQTGSGCRLVAGVPLQETD